MNLFAGTLYALGQMPGSGGQQAPSGGIAGMLFPLVIVFGIFYLLVFRPQKKQKQQHQEMLNDLNKGNKIITSGGIFGQVTRIDDHIVTIKIDNNVKMKILKSSISRVVIDEKKQEITK